MLYSICGHICRFLELLSEKGVGSTIQRALCWEGELVPCEKDLSATKAPDDALAKNGASFVALERSTFRDLKLTFSVRSRRFKAVKYLRRGYSGFAVVRDGDVVGDVWHGRIGASCDELAHRDFSALGITPGPKDVYLFDMYVIPESRGRALATPLLGGALHALAGQGAEKAYGFFEADNIPALWVHRLLKYRELPRVKVRRHLFLSRVVAPSGS